MNWEQCFKWYSAQNEGRPTRLGIFKMHNGVVDDEWIEDGLPFAGIDLEHNDPYQNVTIHLGQMTHNIPEAVKVTIQFTSTGQEDGLDILDSHGRVAVLRFEK